jgi:hypothetical protein
MVFLVKQGVVKEPVAGKELISNDWIDEINKFDMKALVAEAKAYKYH